MSNDTDLNKEQEADFELNKDKITARINMIADVNEARENGEVDKFGRLLNVGKEFKGDENMALFQTLKMMDKALMDENSKDYKATFEKIGFELTDINGEKIQINARLGEGYFQKDLDHLIKMGCNSCDIGGASKVANMLFEKSTELKEPNLEQEQGQEKSKEKGKGLEFKNPATLENFEKILDGGLKGMVTTAESIGDESVKAFVSNMERVTNITGLGKTLPKENKPSREKSAEKLTNDLSEAQVLEGMGKAYAQKIASGAIKAPQEKVREHSNQKSLGASR